MTAAQSMGLNADFSCRVVLHEHDARWSASPMPGVERRMLDRIGDEVARATSIVRYAPGSRFSRHVHGGGEEFLVLDGVFSDEQGDHPAGTYVRNPPGTSHAPYSIQGCTLFVKLWQFASGDTRPVRVDTGAAVWQAGPSAGLSLLRLHEHGGISTTLVRAAPGALVPHPPHTDGEEILVLEGSLHDDQGGYVARSWIRNPGGGRPALRAGADGALIYVKVGHIGAEWLPLPSNEGMADSAAL